MSDDVQFRPGAQISKKIHIEKLIGRGGMAEVYAARHLLLDEDVAVKVLRRELLGQKEVVARFLREARASARVRSEHAVVVYDVDELEGGLPYIVMERLEGEDLAALLERGGRLPVPQGIELVLQACSAVRVAHEQGIIHRDIKPGNLFVARTRSGKTMLKVLDFGISKAITRTAGDGPASSITQVGALLGSPRFMAPEQMVDARNVDARSDIWALACTAYRIVTGVPPFDGSSIPEICGAVLSSTPVRADRVVSTVPAELGAVLARAMAKSRDDRYPDIAAFVAALEPFVRASPAPAVTAVAPAAVPAIDDPPTAVASQSEASVPTVPIAARPQPPDVSLARPDPSFAVPAPQPDPNRWLGATVVSRSHGETSSSARLDATAEGSSLDGAAPRTKSRAGAVIAVGAALAVLAVAAVPLVRHMSSSSSPAHREAGEPMPPAPLPSTASASASPIPPEVVPEASVDRINPSASAQLPENEPAPATSAAPKPIPRPGGPARDPRVRVETKPQAGVPDPFAGSQK